ncbi:MAG: tRNA dihydrouridine synthase DusB [Chromatiaceae bacterium]
MRIGSLLLDNNLILAPMAGVTDRPFRALCRRFGAGLAVAEMVSADTTLWGTRKSLQRLDHRGEPRPIAVQIVGADPVAMAAAARRNVEQGAEVVDINMGCPAKKVCRLAAGSALLRDEPLVARILEAVVAAVEVPVTLKIRTGWSPTERNASRIARIAWDSGVAALTVHGRTRACGYSEPAEYETIRAINREVPIPLIANGDVDSPEKARLVLDYTGADAVMIGRAAQGRPWIFQEIAYYLKSGLRLPVPPLDRVKQVLLEHVQDLYGLYGVSHGVRIARKHVARYCNGRGNAKQFMARFNRVETPKEQQRMIEGFFNE